MGYDNIRNLLRVSASTDNTRVVQKQLPKREPFGYNQFFNKYEKVPIDFYKKQNKTDRDNWVRIGAAANLMRKYYGDKFDKRIPAIASKEPFGSPEPWEHSVKYIPLIRPSEPTASDVLALRDLNTSAPYYDGERKVLNVLDPNVRDKVFFKPDRDLWYTRRHFYNTVLNEKYQWLMRNPYLTEEDLRKKDDSFYQNIIDKSYYMKNKLKITPSQLRRMFEFVQAPVNIEAEQRRLWG